MANQPTYISSGVVFTIQAALLDIVDYITANLTVSTVANQQSIITAIGQTLINAVNALNAYTLQNQLQQEVTLLNNLPYINLGLSFSDSTLINARISALSAFANQVYTLPQWLQFNLAKLATGQPALPSYDLTSFLVNFQSEPPPSGLSVSNLLTMAQAEATAWSNALVGLDAYPSSAASAVYNPVGRMAASCAEVVNLLQFVTLKSPVNMTTIWNSLVAVPAMLRVGSLLVNDPSSFIGQTTNAIKYLTFQLIQQINRWLVSFIFPSVAILPSITTLRAGESLMDVASRALGDVEKWITIAILNNLVPPYVGTIPQAGIAVPGDVLYLSSSGTSVPPVKEYLKNFLGTDIDIGLVGIDDMPNWTGDFNTSYGYTNYGNALARRILTLMGGLIYHPTYGSILPSELGGVQTANGALLLAGDVKNAILADARTQAVTKVAGIALDQITVGLRATAIPKGDVSGGTDVAFAMAPKRTIQGITS